jgi:hypothetical protein
MCKKLNCGNKSQQSIKSTSHINFLIYWDYGIEGDPDRSRTCDPQLRRLLLYPTELPDQKN